MKIILNRMVSLTLFLVLLLPGLAQSFNPAAHIYIAENVFPEWGYNLDLYYGSFAPDISMYVLQPEKWPTGYEDTHRDFIYLKPNRLSQAQKAFKDGWLIHNGVWGADFYAHGNFPESEEGYVIDRAKRLLESFGPISGDFTKDREFAHSIVEAAIDLLLKNEYPELGPKLIEASTSRSPEDLGLMLKAFVWNRKNKRTDWLTLTSAERIFLNFVRQYADAFNSSHLNDLDPMSELGANLASRIYDISIEPNEVKVLIQLAISLCEQEDFHYKDVIQEAIDGIKGHLP
ncbi:MAG: hypothetical protein HXY44_13020 [Syntrophaceae bacterium]|nr:hypothetical protein [Syntrophaceae bacterium]